MKKVFTVKNSTMVPSQNLPAGTEKTTENITIMFSEQK
jgi:hypothetical protein